MTRSGTISLFFIGGSTAMHKQHEYRLVPADKVIVDASRNARVNMNNLDKLEQDIKDNGLLHPPTMVEEKGMYRVVAGFRRATALKRFATQIPAMVTKNLTKVDEYLIQFNENNNREDFTTYEKACALKRLEDEGLSRAEIEDRTGLHQSTLSNYLGLWHLPDEVQTLVRENPDDLAVHHVRFLRSQLKYIEAPAIARLAKEVMGKSQAELDMYRKKLKKKLGVEEEVAAPEPSKEDTAEAARSLPPSGAPLKLLPAATHESEQPAEMPEDSSDTESNHVPRRLATSMRLAIQRLNERGEKVEKGSPTYWRVIGAIEAIQWCLCDEPAFFEGLDIDVE